MNALKKVLNPNLPFIDNKVIYATQILSASLFLALCAQISIPIPISPVPLTMQSLGILLIGVSLKEKKGTLAILLYLAQGCLGAPVWAGGGSGFARLLSPTGGYLMAYPLQVYLIGQCLRGQKQSILKTLFVLMATSCLQLSLGSLWLSQFVGISRCFAQGFFPFLATGTLKVFLVAFSTKLKKKQK